MNFNLPSSSSANTSSSSSSSPALTGRPARAPPSAWGSAAPGSATRRGLTSLTTSSASASSATGPVPNTSDSTRNKGPTSSSPFPSSFSAVLNSSGSGLQNHIQTFPTTSGPGGARQTGTSLGQIGQSAANSSMRSRTNTPSSSNHAANSNANTSNANAVQNAGNSLNTGATMNRNAPFPSNASNMASGLPSPITQVFDRSGYPLSATSPAPSQSSVSKIVATQINLLLGSITEKEGKAKWESQAEAIRKLVENGMENFPKYFRRLISGNAPQIFPEISRNVENPANYPILVREVEKVLKDPGQAPRLVEAVDGGEGEPFFRDFNLSAFLDHFKLNVYGKTILASAFAQSSKEDTRSRAISYLKENFEELGKALANHENANPNTPPTLLATAAIRYLHSTLPDSLASQDYDRVKLFLNHRYQAAESEVPYEIQSLFDVMELDGLEKGFYDEVVNVGPRVTRSHEAVVEFLSNRAEVNLEEKEVGHALLFMVLSPDWEAYNVSVFVGALLAFVESSFNWNQVLAGFDKNVSVRKPQFLELYELVKSVAATKSGFDIQSLWTTPYRFRSFHLSVLSCLLECSPEEIDIGDIPAFKAAFDPETVLEDNSEFADLVSRYKSDIMLSSNVISILLETALPVGEDLTEIKLLQIGRILGNKVGIFLCATSRLENLATNRQQLLRGLIRTYYLGKQLPDHEYVLRVVWSHDKKAIAQALIDAHVADPLELTSMLNLALKFGWLDGLLTMTTAFAFDLAALANRDGLIDFTEWANEKMTSGDQNGFVTALSRFVLIKTQDELRISRDEQPEPRTVTLSMRTAYDMLAILEQRMEDQSDLKILQRTFLQAYPRLLLLCEGIQDNIDVDCTTSNAMPRSADAEMQELYKKMYGRQLEVPKVIQHLQECKSSDDPQQLDLFACMIHGLFDEYSCFSEYPVDPLQKTALLFGGIIKVGLISDLTLRVARDMVFDALSDFPPTATMHKFGLQALSTFAERLVDPSWSEYCKGLITIPALRDTQIYRHILDALSQGENGQDPRETSHGIDLPATTLEAAPIRFISVNAGTKPEYLEPDEITKDKIVFFFNNVSQQNLGERFDQLRKPLIDIDLGWFADFLVNARAKVEPNYQPLYLDVLNMLRSRSLWSDVLNATFLSIQSLLDAETTMQSASERKNLKSLAIWLGSLTLAQDKPIKRRNISFLDLLIEGFQQEKLLLVIPFTCNVLAQGKHSTVFKPPNPWILEIMAALVELYQDGSITTNQKFDIEVLCDELNVDMKEIEPSRILRERPPSESGEQVVALSDGSRMIDNTAMNTFHGAGPLSKFDAQVLSFDIADIEPMLKFPPASGSPASQARLRQVVVDAISHAIHEIIGSVVERSVTIATIAASNLIHKDFSCEEDGEKVRSAAQRLTRELASSLALVTSKDPLRTSISNYIRNSQDETADPAFPEGTILMCVNDNLDIACQLVEDKAAEQSLPEIETHIERELVARAQHRIDHPNVAYVGPAHNRWSTIIPEPFKQIPGSLKPEQLAIYEDFGRQSRIPGSHAASSSVDTGRQLPDILGDPFSVNSSSSRIPDGSDGLALHQQSQQLQGQRGRILPPAQGSISSLQPNGYIESAMIEERVGDLLGEIVRITIENEDRSFEYLRTETPLFSLVERVREIAISHDGVAMNCAENICKTLSGDSQINSQLAEIMVHILATLCQTYSVIAKEVAHWADLQKEPKVLSTDVTLELVRKGIMQLRKVDHSLASLLRQRDALAVESLSNILEDLLFTPHPSAFRADFAKSFEALAQWSSEDSDIPGAKEIWTKLSQSVLPEPDADGATDEQGLIKKHQINYIFSEWIQLCDQYHDPENSKIFSTFVAQVHLKKILATRDDLALFLRLTLDASIGSMELIEQDDRQRNRHQWEQSDRKFTELDALARLIVFLFMNQKDSNGDAWNGKAMFLDSILSILLLILNHHIITRKGHFNQRAFSRIMNSVISYWHEVFEGRSPAHDQIMLVFVRSIANLGPRHFPGFIFGWLGLITNRHLVPGVLKLADEEARSVLIETWATALTYITEYVRCSNLSPAALELYRGLLRMLLVVHREFPDLLADSHWRLCTAVSADNTQILNLVLSAHPSYLPEIPSPFISGLKLDRLEESRRVPRIMGDYTILLEEARILTVTDEALRTGEISAEVTQLISQACDCDADQHGKVNAEVLNNLIVHIGESALASLEQRTALQPESAPAMLIKLLFKEFRPEGRYHFICAIVNQLRWPSASTQWFTSILLLLFKSDSDEETDWSEQQQILAVILQRINVVLPHPWGVTAAMLELLKNPAYRFWQLPFVKDSPQVQAFCEDLMKQSEERAQRGPTASYTQAT